jgi:hypothetical protein
MERRRTFRAGPTRRDSTPRRLELLESINEVKEHIHQRPLHVLARLRHELIVEADGYAPIEAATKSCAAATANVCIASPKRRVLTPTPNALNGTLKSSKRGLVPSVFRNLQRTRPREKPPRRWNAGLSRSRRRVRAPSARQSKALMRREFAAFVVLPERERENDPHKIRHKMRVLSGHQRH